MSDPFFNLSDWEPMFTVNDNWAVDLKGKFTMRLNDNMSFDPETGKVIFTTPWPSNSDDKKDDDDD